MNTNLFAIALVFTVLGLLASQRRQGIGAWLFAIAGVLYWLCGIGPVAWALVDGLFHAVGGH